MIFVKFDIGSIIDYSDHCSYYKVTYIGIFILDRDYQLPPVSLQNLSDFRLDLDFSSTWLSQNFVADVALDNH